MFTVALPENCIFWSFRSKWVFRSQPDSVWYFRPPVVAETPKCFGEMHWESDKVKNALDDISVISKLNECMQAFGEVNMDVNDQVNYAVTYLAEAVRLSADKYFIAILIRIWFIAIEINPDGQMKNGNKEIKHFCVVWIFTSGTNLIQSVWKWCKIVSAIRNIVNKGIPSINNSKLRNFCPLGLAM